MHIISFDRSFEILLFHSYFWQKRPETWCTNTLKLIRMLEYLNNTYNNSY